MRGSVGADLRSLDTRGTNIDLEKTDDEQGDGVMGSASVDPLRTGIETEERSSVSSGGWRENSATDGGPLRKDKEPHWRGNEASEEAHAGWEWGSERGPYRSPSWCLRMRDRGRGG